MGLFHKEMDAQVDRKHVEEFYASDAAMKRRKKALYGFLIAFAVLILFTILNWGVITSWGKVDITRVNVIGNNGTTWSALVYRPENATDATPAPGVIMYHGNSGNARNHESWAVEFSRRGFVVVSIDESYKGSGNSTYTNSKGTDMEEAEFWFQYLKSLKFVDKNNCLTTGHSAGTAFAWDIGAKNDAKGILTAAGTSPFRAHYSGKTEPAEIIAEKEALKSGKSVEKKAKSAEMGTATKTKDAKATAETKTTGEAASEKGGTTKSTAGKMSKAPSITEWNHDWYFYTGPVVICMGETEMYNYSGTQNADDFLQLALPILNRYPGYENYERVEADTEYGSLEDGSGFIFCVEDHRIHEAAFVSPITIGHLVHYAQVIVDEVPNYIDSQDQVWMYKDYIALFSCFAFAFFMFHLAFLLIAYVPVFSKLERPLAKNIGARGWEMVLVIAIGLVAPFVAMKTDCFGIVGGKNGDGLTKLGFHMKYSNLNLGVIIGCGIFAIIGLGLFLFGNRKKKYNLSDYGLAPDTWNVNAPLAEKALSVYGIIWRTLLLVSIVIGTGFGYIKLMNELCGTDFYCWFFGIKDIPIAKIPAMLPYIMVYVPLQIVFAIDINVIRRFPTTGKDWLDTIIAILINMAVASFAVILVVAGKWILQSNCMWDVDSNWFWSMGMDTQRIWGMPLGIGIASCGSTYVYRKTGNAWLSGILMGVLGGIMVTLFGQYQFDFLTYPYF